jgi:tRNA(fMet)-specific endonuclease VapC
MFVLDTDHLSLLQWGVGEEAERLRARLQAACEEVALTVVSYEEQTRGWLAYVARARTLGQQVEAYRRLRRHLDVYRTARLLDFDEQAATEFQRLQRLRVRIGSMDLRIAAIALTHRAVLLTRNAVDFGKVPNLQIEDWTG